MLGNPRVTRVSVIQIAKRKGITMRKAIIPISVLALLFLFSSTVHADCRGCCSRRGGVTCRDGITLCADGTQLSQTCIAKACDVCPEDSAVSSDTIKVASFNIQVFGRTKAGKPEVMEILAQTIVNFDIVGIQEIRDKTGTAIKDLEVAVDVLGTNYDYILGPRLGRTNQKEQYAFMYNTETVTKLGSYTYDDSGSDTYHREPFIAHFKAKDAPFDVVIINIHVDPDDAEAEINNLPTVIADATTRLSESDVILLGDLNADCDYFDEEDQTSPLRAQGFRWLITNDLDTNVAASSCTYDRIISTPTLNQDYTGNAGVFRFDQEYELDCEPKEVSDHYPVVAEFHVGNDTD
jgi:endonuclease/exonuclease/phosphatase family metal-dependent hydrolase